jgi:hypothetical protein
MNCGILMWAMLQHEWLPSSLYREWERLGACRTLGIDSENVAERGQILTILPAPSP